MAMHQRDVAAIVVTRSVGKRKTRARLKKKATVDKAMTMAQVRTVPMKVTNIAIGALERSMLMAMNEASFGLVETNC